MGPGPGNSAHVCDVTAVHKQARQAMADGKELTTYQKAVIQAKIVEES